MRTFTLDWNCLIEVEENRPEAEDVCRLIELHRASRCNVGLLATSASENNRSRRFPGNAKHFKDRVALLGFSDLPIVLAPSVFGLTYFDWSFRVDEEEYNTLVPLLWAAMFPDYDRDAKSHLKCGQILDDATIQSEQLADWRNRWCDVMSAYSHIHATRDVFVTLNTRDFQRRSHELAKIGIEKILKPSECFALL